MLATEFTSTDLGLIVAILLLLVALGALAVAETSLNRVSRVRAATLAEEHPSKSTEALVQLVAHP